MIKKFQFVCGALVALLAWGCSSERIEFSSDAQLSTARQPAEAAVLSSEPKLTKEELFKVQVTIFGYLLQRQFPGKSDYSAVFVQGDDAEVAALIKQFPDHVPPIKPSDLVDLQPNRAPLDRQTGKPAMILSVDALDPVGDTIQAVGRWFAGGTVSGLYTFVLRKAGGDWVIESVK